MVVGDHTTMSDHSFWTASLKKEQTKQRTSCTTIAFALFDALMDDKPLSLELQFLETLISKPFQSHSQDYKAPFTALIVPKAHPEGLFFPIPFSKDCATSSNIFRNEIQHCSTPQWFPGPSDIPGLTPFISCASACLEDKRSGCTK